MIIYNNEWLKNRKIQDQTMLAFNSGEIDAEELKTIKARYPVGFYTPNVFIRLGIFLLTLVILSFSFGLISLISYDLKIVDSPYYLFFLAVLTYVALESIVSAKHHYQSGADDALMWTSAGLLLAAYIFMMDLISLSAHFHHEEIFLFGFSFLLAGYLTLRFADALMAVTCILAFAAFVCFGWMEIGIYPLHTLPFLMMALTGTLLYSSYLLEKKKLYLLYSNCISAAKMLSPLLLYASGNYFVVRELGASFGAEVLKEGQGIPFGWFFWCWTFISPLLYISYGLKKKDVILLRSGLILVAVAAFTLKNYYHLMPPEHLLVLVGAGLIGIAWIAMRYLKDNKYGFTAAEIEDDDLLDKIQVESLIVGETFSGSQPDLQSQRMGGGTFGGGGASSNF
ncbi:hypothetical protein [Pedobacter sp. GR22-6]|uniref:hypothetical protein n=1 Tax=Pedobacter sp. GR22-6 TaxID=3127957 RepID=UPI00307ECC9B